ncbi:hypothetical protein KYC5002_23535 [Archangium violaceum]|nr:hypothetical protein KYC5002_23535 [Archangium gephyra]
MDGKWKGGRTFNGKDGRPVFVLHKMVQGRAYTDHLDWPPMAPPNTTG